MNILEARQLTKVYTIEDRNIPVLENISLAVPQGEFLVIEGSSGSGKTTLLSLLSGLDKPTTGRVFIASGSGGRTGSPGELLLARRRRLSPQGGMC